jgi:NACHT domain
MRAGRPRKAGQEPSSELAELAAWFYAALVTAGYGSVNQFLQAHPVSDKNAVYGLMNGTRFLTLKSVTAIAVALGREPAEVEPIWYRAKQGMDLTLRINPSGQPASWDGLPQLDHHVRDLLLAQASSTELLPYKLLGLESPPLSTIYVRQHLRSENDALHGEPEQPGHVVDNPVREEAVPAAAAVGRHEHLLITGEPGMGKTVLAQDLSRRLARIWLREDPASDPPTSQPVIPLLLPARVFTETGSFSSVLAAAVRDVYGIAMLSEPRPELFAGPVHRSRWLLFVDGLDEVADQNLRARIVRAIAGHARADAPYRFIVTTRPLPRAELEPLRRGPFATYTIEPFGQAELQDFAKRWFAAQSPASCDEQTRSFLQATRDGRLKEAVLNPLLASIAVMAKTLDPDLPLPASRIGLYGRFCDYVVSDELTGRTTLQQIRERADEPRHAEWVYNHRAELVAHLAERHLAGEQSLLGTARAWIGERCPGSAQETALSDHDLREILLGTGLLKPEGTGIRFVHQAIAEYLAARAAAERLPAELPDLKTWIGHAVDHTHANTAVYTLVLWSQMGGNIGTVLQHLLDGPPRHLIFAGRILGDWGSGRPAETTQIVDRLFDLALGGAAVMYRDDFGHDLADEPAAQEPDNATASPDEVFWVIGRICGEPYIIARLRDVATCIELATETRTHAALALGRASDHEEAQTILSSLAGDNISDAARVLISEAILALDGDATAGAELVLQRMGSEPDSRDALLRAAELLARIGRPLQAADLAWTVLDASEFSPANTVGSVRLILRHQGADAVTALIDTADKLLGTTSPAVRWILVELARFGAHDAVIGFCRRALADPRLHSWQPPRVAGGWVMAAGPAAIAEVTGALHERGAWNTESAGEISLRLLETGYQAESFEIAMEILTSGSERYPSSEAGWICLSTAPPERLPELLPLIDQLPPSDGRTSDRITEILAQLGETTRARLRAKALIENKVLLFKPRILSAAVKTLKSTGDPEVLVEEFSQRIKTEKFSMHKIQLIEAIMELGNPGRAAEMAREALADRWMSGVDLRRSGRVLMLANGYNAGNEIIGLLMYRQEKRSWLQKKEFLVAADCVARLGALPAATQIWLELLTDLSISLNINFKACSSIIQSGQRELAINSLQDMLHGQHLTTAERARLGALLSWAVLRSPGENPSTPEAAVGIA